MGGIGIVFDSTPQFEAMLMDSLPRDEKGQVREGLFALFCDKNRCIISSSTTNYQVGDYLEIDDCFFNVKNGQGKSKIIKFNGKYYAVGSCKSSGYREYKTVDQYSNDVISLTFAPLASVDKNFSSDQETFKRPNLQFTETNGEKILEAATFIIKNRTYAFRTESIHKAINMEGLTPIPGSHKLLLGKIFDGEDAIPVIDFPQLIDDSKDYKKDTCQIIVIKGRNTNFGIIVDTLGATPSIPLNKIDFNSSLLDGADKYTEGVLLPPDAKSHYEMIILLDAKRMWDYLADIGTFELSKRKLDKLGDHGHGKDGRRRQDSA